MTRSKREREREREEFEKQNQSVAAKCPAPMAAAAAAAAAAQSAERVRDELYSGVVMLPSDGANEVLARTYCSVRKEVARGKRRRRRR